MSGGRSASHAADAAPRGAETPFRRIVADFVANPVAVFGLVLLGVHPAARALRAADLAAESRTTSRSST